VKLVPRLPDGWKAVNVNGFTAALPGRKHGKIDFRYERITGEDAGCDGQYRRTVCAVCEGTGCGYRASWNSDFEVKSLRIGPFASDNISVSGGSLLCVRKINGRYFADIMLKS